MEVPRRRPFYPCDLPMDPPSYSERDDGYFSTHSSDSGHSDGTSEVSDWSRDSPPYFKEESLTAAIKKALKQLFNESVASPVCVAAFFVVLVAVLYLFSGLFSKEKMVNLEMKIVLGSSGEEMGGEGMEKLMKQFMRQLKVEVESQALTALQVGSKTEQDTCSGFFGCTWGFICGVIVSVISTAWFIIKWVAIILIVFAIVVNFKTIKTKALLLINQANQANQANRGQRR